MIQNDIIEEAAHVAHHGLDIWLKAIFWTIIGIALVKSFVYPFGQVKFKTWIVGYPIQDIIRGILLTLVVVFLGDSVLHIAEYLGFNTGKLQGLFDKIGVDPIRISLVVSIIVQVLIYRWRKGKPLYTQQ